MHLNLILMAFAFVLFVLGAIPIGSRFNLVSAGLACWSAAVLLGGFSLS